SARNRAGLHFLAGPAAARHLRRIPDRGFLPSREPLVPPLAVLGPGTLTLQVRCHRRPARKLVALANWVSLQQRTRKALRRYAAPSPAQPPRRAPPAPLTIRRYNPGTP